MNFSTNATDSSCCNSHISLPPKPIEPEESDCCGSGCQPCIFDLYEQELRMWEKQCSILSSSTTETIRDCEGESLCQDEYRFFKLIEIIPAGFNCNIYRFNSSNVVSDQVKIGQHLVLRCYSDDNECITRQYTPIFIDDSYFEVMIRQYDGAKMSSIIKNWTSNVEAEWRGPFGHFYYQRNKFRNILMLAAGTGIAPMLRIINSVTDDESDESFIRLIYSNKTYDDILMKNSIDDYKKYWNFTVLYAISQGTITDKTTYGDELHYGRIDESLIGRETKQMSPRDTLVLVCGSKSFTNDMMTISIRGQRIPEENCFRF
ncbi:CYB5RL (predicted) [Pycnogonum litorale]